MRDLPALDGDVDELDGRGHCAIPGLVDCHTHPCFAGDRVEEFSLRAAGASYEELHAAGGGILSTVRATRAAARTSSRGRFDRHRGVDARARARRRSRGSRATGSTATPSSRRCARSRAAGGVPTWLGAHAVPPEFDDADAYLDFALAEVLPEAARARGGGGRLPRARRVRRRTGAPLSRGVPRRRARAAAARRPVHRVRARSRSRSSSARARSTTSRRPATDGVRALARSRRRRRPAARERALPRPADAAGARARRRRRRGRARDRLQPGERVLREPAARLLARVHAASTLAGRGARARAR